MAERSSRLSMMRWTFLALVGVGLPVATCRRSLSGPVDVPLLADIVTIAFYVTVFVCLGVSLMLSLPRSE